MKENNKEVWKNIGTIEGYEDFSNYEVSNLGRVRSIERTIIKVNGTKGKKTEVTFKSRVLKPETLKKIGYVMVNLIPANGGKQRHCYVHRLVGLAFIPNPENLKELNHIDEDKNNNCVDNLQWMSHGDNMRYGYQKQRGNNLRAYRKGKATNLIINKTAYVYRMGEGKELLQQDNVKEVNWNKETTANYYNSLEG